MMDYRRSWLSFAVNDNAFFHVMLSYGEADINFTQQKGDPIEAVGHRMKSVCIINERLRSPVGRLSDGTIATVAALANYEVCFTYSSSLHIQF
jgi:hypothetical protein